MGPGRRYGETGSGAALKLGPRCVDVQLKILIVLLCIQEEQVKGRHIPSSRKWIGMISWVRTLFVPKVEEDEDTSYFESSYQQRHMTNQTRV